MSVVPLLVALIIASTFATFRTLRSVERWILFAGIVLCVLVALPFTEPAATAIDDVALAAGAACVGGASVNLLRMLNEIGKHF